VGIKRSGRRGFAEKRFPSGELPSYQSVNKQALFVDENFLMAISGLVRNIDRF